LELIEVKGYVSQEIEQGGMERFSVFFVGPADPFLPPRLYPMEHDRMDEFEISFAGNEQGFRYEAVFNYSRHNPQITPFALFLAPGGAGPER
jgi:hypothetical protein